MPTKPTDDMQKVLDQIAAGKTPPMDSLEPRIARELPSPATAIMELHAKNMMKRTMAPLPTPVEGGITHTLIPGKGGDLLARIYTPAGDGPFPVLLYFHGGGWVIANLDTYDGSCRALTNAAECVVVALAYRQAPEHPFPAAVDDAYAAYQWLLQNAASIGGDPARIAVGGESAGGNLAAVVCLVAKEEGAPLPVHQLLVYPVTNFEFDTPSYKDSADAKPLNASMMRWFWKHYLANEADGKNPHASPLQAKDLSGLPPATVINAEIDPLRSEGEIYAARLAEAGVPVRATCYPGVTHEFFGMGAIVPEAMDAVKEAAAALKDAFDGATTAKRTTASAMR